MRNPIEFVKDVFSSKKGATMEDSKNWYKEEIKKTKHVERIGRVTDIDEYLRREHKVLQIPSFQFKEHEFEPTKIVLQTLKSIIKFHSYYIYRQPV